MSWDEQNSRKGIHVQMIREMWFQPNRVHFFFAVRLISAFTMKVSNVIIQEEDVYPDLFFVAHLSVSPKLVNLVIASIDDGDPWRDFKAGGGMVILKGASPGPQGGWSKRVRGTVRFGGTGEFETIPARMCMKAIMRAGLHLAHWHPRDASTHSGSSGKESEFTHMALSKQSHVASV